MQCKYETRVATVCPANRAVLDHYDVTFLHIAMIPVEDIVAALNGYSGKEVFQEDLTKALSEMFKCRVITVGFHSNVKTTVEVNTPLGTLMEVP
jgi:cytochrome c oxidase assembly protein Cox11